MDLNRLEWKSLIADDPDIRLVPLIMEKIILHKKSQVEENILLIQIKFKWILFVMAKDNSKSIKITFDICMFVFSERNKLRCHATHFHKFKHWI